jgi:hypothetical protein
MQMWWPRTGHSVHQRTISLDPSRTVSGAVDGASRIRIVA